MAISSLLIKFSDFGWAEWCIVGIFAVIAVFAFIKGYRKGFINVKLRTLSWAFGCGVFVVLDKFLHDRCFVVTILQAISSKFRYAEVASFVSTATWMAVALLLRWVIFGAVHVYVSQYKARLLKKAAKIARREKETGEEYLPDENKVYKPLPIDGVIKSGPLGRLLGGFCQTMTAIAVAGTFVAIMLVVIRQTSLYQYLAPYNTGALARVLRLVKKYAVDIVWMTLGSVIVIKGYKDGILNGINTVGVSVVKVIAIAGAMYLPFTMLTAPDGMLEFLSIGAENLGARIDIPLPAIFKTTIVKLGFSIVLCAVAWVAVKMLAIGCDKLLDYVDDNPALWRVDGVIGALVYGIITLAVMAVMMFMMYSIEFFGTFPMSSLFIENSSLVGGAFKAFDVTIQPLLEEIRIIFTVRA